MVGKKRKKKKENRWAGREGGWAGRGGGGGDGRLTGRGRGSGGAGGGGGGNTQNKVFSSPASIKADFVVDYQCCQPFTTDI